MLGKGSDDMYKLVLSLEWRCHPVFVYDTENGGCVDNDLPSDFPDRERMNTILWAIQDKYDALFIDTPTQFSFAGFRDRKEAEAFNDEVDAAVNLLIELNAGKYPVENRICKI